MQKYRRWTDQKVGVNPFVAAKTEKISLIGHCLVLVGSLLKGICFFMYLPLFFVLYLIPLSFLQKMSARILLYLFGVYSMEDFTLERCDKGGKVKTVLANHTCFIDIFYFLYRYPNCSFLMFQQNQQQQTTYSLISPLKALILALTRLQPFFQLTEQQGTKNLQDLLSKAKKVIIFYEKIRTNGKGTCKIDKTFCQQIYDLNQDVLIAQLKYTSKNADLFCMTSSGFSVLMSALGTVAPGNNLKVRAIKQSVEDTHSSREMQDAIFFMAQGPLLETQARSYYEFWQFFKKTQKEGYKSE